eukprot:437826_1
MNPEIKQKIEEHLSVQVQSGNEFENYLESKMIRHEKNDSSKEIRKWYSIKIDNFRNWWMHRFNHVMILGYTTKQTNSHFNYNKFLDHPYYESYEQPNNCIHYHNNSNLLYIFKNGNSKNITTNNNNNLICTDYIMKNYLDPSIKQNDVKNAKKK